MEISPLFLKFGKNILNKSCLVSSVFSYAYILIYTGCLKKLVTFLRHPVYFKCQHVKKQMKPNNFCSQYFFRTSKIKEIFPFKELSGSLYTGWRNSVTKYHISLTFHN